MTTQIFLDLILSGRISLQNCCLLIFDECHHGVENHPMRQVYIKLVSLNVTFSANPYTPDKDTTFILQGH